MKKYKSEIGFSFYVMAVLSAAILLLPLILVWKNSVSISETIILLVAYILVAVAYYFSVIYPLLNTTYIIEDKKLIIRSGFYRKTILCSQIVEIIEKKSFAREPALSTNRVYIKYSDAQGRYQIGISPKNRQEFLKSLQIDRR